MFYGLCRHDIEHILYVLTLIVPKCNKKRYGYLGNDLVENIELGHNPSQHFIQCKKVF